MTPPTVVPDLKTMYGNGASAYLFAAQVAEVEVDPETGRVKVLNAVLAPDVGRAINPMIVEGITEGGVGLEIGFALMEQIIHEQGTVVNANFIDYRVSTAINMPRVKTFLVETNDPYGPYGAKGCCHAAESTTAAALANAIYNAVGVRINELPITPMKVLKALERNRKVV
ncbi:molybdopterin cofactor-binding domain-containing protein [Chloroflexota bacterium]